MAAEKKRARRRKKDSAACLYLGCFFFDEPGERERTGGFQIVAEAKDPLDAVDRCRDRLRSLRTRTTLFDDPVTIYIEGIIKPSPAERAAKQAAAEAARNEAAAKRKRRDALRSTLEELRAKNRARSKNEGGE